jgi:queuine tRNA-ribosyltransferase
MALLAMQDVNIAFGGIHEFTRWSGPILTDSGGFQVFSLSRLRTVSEDGIEFRSHIDGSMHEYTPESVMRIERNIGADVIMQLDELIRGQSELGAARSAMERSLRWLTRCRIEFDRIGMQGREPLPQLATPSGAPELAGDNAAPDQALFPIVQGGTHPTLRMASVQGILQSGEWAGIAIGGLSVGETKADTYAMIEVCAAALPRTLPRYLMGVGFPDDLVEGVRRGIDLFDCVAPTRMGRDGTAFTPDGKIQIMQSSHRTDRRALVEDCGCPCCVKYDRAYLRHLFASDEMLGKRLVALHNVSFLVGVMRAARAALIAGDFGAWSTAWLDRYRAARASV